MGRAGRSEPSAPNKIHPEKPPPYNPGMPGQRPHSPGPPFMHHPPRSPMPPRSPYVGPPHPPGPFHGGPPPGPHHHHPPAVVHESATFSSFNVNLNMGAELPRPTSTPVIVAGAAPVVEVKHVPVPVSVPVYQPVPQQVYYQAPAPQAAAPSTVVINAGQGHGGTVLVEKKRSKWWLPCWVHCLITLLFPPWIIAWICCCIFVDGSKTQTTCNCRIEQEMVWTEERKFRDRDQVKATKIGLGVDQT